MNDYLFKDKIDRRVLRLIERLDALKGSSSTWLVGGSVRDLLLARPIHDIDLCTTFLPDEVKRHLPDLSVIPTGLAHGTVTVLAWGIPIEVTTLRREGPYSDLRRPDEVEFVKDINIDLARRDFTMNAIAWHPIDGFIDPFLGIEDINNKRIKAVGNPTKRFEEDALRILRALRFSAQLNFELEEKTKDALVSTAHLLPHIARERILDELRQMMGYPSFKDLYLKWPELFSYVFPTLEKHIQYRNEAVRFYEHTADEAIRFALLFNPLYEVDPKLCKKALNELLLPKRKILDTFTILEAVHLELWEDVYTRSFIRHGLKRWPEHWHLILETLRLMRVERIDVLINGTKEVLDQGLPYRLSHLAVDGQDLINLGIPRGPVIGKLLNKLLDLVIEDEVKNNRIDLLDKALDIHANDVLA